EVGYGRASFEDHSENEAKGVNTPGEDDDVERRASQCFGDIGSDGEGQQSDASHDQGENVHDDGVQEGLDIVVIEFGAAFFEFPGKVRCEPGFVVVNGAIEFGGVFFAVGCGDCGELNQRSWELIGAREFENAVPGVLPSVA